MIDTCLEWLLANKPLAAVIVLLLFAAIFITTKINSWRSRLNSVEKDCQRIGQIEPQLLSIQKSISGLVIYLKGRDTNMDTALFQAQSPIQLTEAGERLLLESGGKKFVDANEKELISKMESYEIKTELDAQEMAPIVIESQDHLPEFEVIKRYIYNNPRFIIDAQKNTSIPVDMAAISAVLGIYLRNKFLAKHPNLTAE